MVVHRIQIMTSTDVAPDKVRNKVADLKSKYGEKLDKENAPFELGESMDGTAFYRGSFILEMDEDNKASERDNLLEQIRKEMDKSASWWQLRWHRCTHDGSKRTVTKTRDDGTTYTDEVKGCAWETKQYSDKSVIPSEVLY